MHSGRDMPGGMVVAVSACLTVLAALAVDWDRLLTGENIDLSTLLPCEESVGSRWENADGTMRWDLRIPVVCSGTAPFGLRLQQ